MQDQKKLRTYFSPLLENMGYRCVFISLLKGKKPRLQIFIERLDNASITMEDCTYVTHHLLNALEENDPIEGNYLIEVSSPGVDRPLVTQEDFKRFKGEIAQIVLIHPIQGQKKFKGILLECSNTETIMIEIQDTSNEKKEISFPFLDIQRANLVEKLAEKGKKSSPIKQDIPLKLKNSKKRNKTHA